MHSSQWLKDSTKKLKDNNISTARLDCIVLLEDITGKDRGYLIAHPELSLDTQHLTKLNWLIGRRAQHEPLAYIRGKTEFYGREFYIDSRVLEPRPESETMIELLLSIKLTSEPSLIDVGTGSGALGITAALEIPGSQIILTDIDPGCLTVASKNIKKHKVNAQLLKGDLLEPLASSNFQLPTSILLANLPYVPDSHTVNQAALMEPRIAIFGGQDGLDLYRHLFEQLKNQTHKPEYILTEALPFQHKELATIASFSGYSLEQSEDFIQCFKG